MDRSGLSKLTPSYDRQQVLLTSGLPIRAIVSSHVSNKEQKSCLTIPTTPEGLWTYIIFHKMGCGRVTRVVKHKAVGRFVRAQLRVMAGGVSFVTDQLSRLNADSSSAFKRAQM